MREDQVHIGANQFGGQFRKSLVVPLRPAVLDGDVRTLDITGVAQTQADSPKPRGKRRWRCHAEESDPRHLARLLRTRGARPRGGGGEQRQECAALYPVHSRASGNPGAADCGPGSPLSRGRTDVGLSAPDHSITSSARASSVRGTSRPSALAVLRLITSSNLVGCFSRLSYITGSRSSAERSTIAWR